MTANETRAERQRRNEELRLRGDPYWTDQLERWLNRFGASTSDLPELDPDSANTPKQLRVAQRVRRKFLVCRMREIAKAHEDEGEAQDAVCELLLKAVQVVDAVEWCRIDMRYHAGDGPFVMSEAVNSG